MRGCTNHNFYNWVQLYCIQQTTNVTIWCMFFSLSAFSIDSQWTYEWNTMLAWLLEQTNIHFTISNISNLIRRRMGECAFGGGIKNVWFLIHFVYLHTYSVCQSAAILYICIYTTYVRVLPFCISAYIQSMSEYCHFVYLHMQGVPGGMWNTSGECSLC